MYFWHSRNLSDIHHGLQEAAGSRAEEAIGDQNYIRLDNFLFLSDNQVGQSGSSPMVYPLMAERMNETNGRSDHLPSDNLKDVLS
jgi:hypothetical protein